MTRAQLASAIEHLPDTATLSLPVAELRGLLVSPSEPGDRDLSAAEVGRQPAIRRSAATVRRWQKLHPFSGAYRDPAGEWRFPPATVRDMLSWYRAGGPKKLRPKDVTEGIGEMTPNPTPPTRSPTDDDDDNLSAWRTEK